MQSRPSDSREQKVGRRRRVSGRGSSGEAFVRRQWQKGVEGALLNAIHRQFVSPAVEARPKTCEQLEPHHSVIDKRTGLQELHFDMNKDKSVTTFCECLILPPLSGDSGQALCPHLGIHKAKREVSTPLLIKNFMEKMPLFSNCFVINSHFQPSD